MIHNNAHNSFPFSNRGCDFGRDYSKLGVLCALYPEVPVLAMRASQQQQVRLT